MTELVLGDASQPIVETIAVQAHFPIERGLLRRVHGHVQAVDGIDLTIMPGQSIGLVGESGSGKSTLARLITRLIEPTGGAVRFDGRDITHASQSDIRPLRRHMQMVFQDPYTSLAPFNSVGASVAEPLQTHFGLRGKDADVRVAELFRRVRLNPAHRSRYPHEFSGGQLQRISIARALATEPKIVVLDEPVSSLDVSTQAEIINLLSDLRSDLKVAYLFISHDLSLVRHVSDKVFVMHLGRIVESGATESVYTKPRHPYTEALLSAVPIPDPDAQHARNRIVLIGDVPSPADPPRGCRFHTRCPAVMDVCREIDPPASQADDGSIVFCHLHRPTGTDNTTLTSVTISSNGSR
jgi:oligopeptide/dipeptide ABC transporter ATP-binding protein